MKPFPKGRIWKHASELNLEDTRLRKTACGELVFDSSAGVYSGLYADVYYVFEDDVTSTPSGEKSVL